MIGSAIGDVTDSTLRSCDRAGGSAAADGVLLTANHLAQSLSTADFGVWTSCRIENQHFDTLLLLLLLFLLILGFESWVRFSGRRLELVQASLVLHSSDRGGCCLLGFPCLLE